MSHTAWQGLGVVAVLAFVMWQSAGRLALKATLFPPLFLFTRRPVLLTWALSAAAIVLWLGHEAEGRGRSPSVGLLLGVSLVSGLGFALMLVGPVFFASRLRLAVPTLALEPAEQVLFRRPGNHWRQGEARGGAFLVTTQRLAFVPNRFNVQLEGWSVPLSAPFTFHREGERLVLLQRPAQADEWLVPMAPSLLIEQVEQVRAVPEGERAARFPPVA
jgi:hypothetical protein